MRKMKKINGYLVVKFNARELREYEGTALGEYGVIDAELYTGILDVDRGAMEYDNAGSMEEAVELARGLESELDAEEPEVKVTIVKETDETTEEEEVDAQQMIAGWENVLRGQVASAHYKDVDERTAAHELYAEDVRVKNKIIRETRKEGLLLLNDDIDLEDVQGELETRAKFMFVPLQRMIDAKEISSAEITVPEGQEETILEDETMRVKIRYVSRGYIREVEVDLGRAQPSD